VARPRSLITCFQWYVDYPDRVWLDSQSVGFLRSIRFPLLWVLIANAPQDHTRMIAVSPHR